MIGWRADQPEFQGGGSAQVTPPYVITPLQGISDRAGDGVVTFEAGRTAPRSAPLGGRLLATDGGAGDAPGVRLDYFPAGDLAGTPLRTETVRETMAVWLGEPAPGVTAGDFSARLTAAFTPDVSGPWTLSVSGVGTARLFLDGELLVDTTDAPPGTEFFGLFTVPVEAEVELAAGAVYEVAAELDAAAAEGPIPLAGLTVEARPPAQPDAVERAVQAAAGADVAVVVVGQDDRETEGQDAASMDLPPEQVALVRQVAAANPRTVVVVNAASPVTMDWADDVAAIVQMSYLGQETGAALAAVLFGDADASGRLTTTYPRRLEDSPAFPNFPGRDGTVEYAEGVFVGYRHYDTHGVDPRWCFGHGLSYTTFAYSPLTTAVGPRSATMAPSCGCRSTSPTPATARAARSCRCTCATSTPLSRGPTASSRRSRRSRSTRARPPPSRSPSTGGRSPTGTQTARGGTCRLAPTRSWSDRPHEPSTRQPPGPARASDRPRLLSAGSEEALDVGGEAGAEVVEVEAHVGGPVVDAAEPAPLVGVQVGAHGGVDVGGRTVDRPARGRGAPWRGRRP